MADMVEVKKKIALLHRYPAHRIAETNAAFPYLQAKGIDVLTFRKFDRLGGRAKFIKSLMWIVYAPLLVMWRGYDVIYCDDSYPFYPILVKLVCPKAKVILRIGDLHLMYLYSGWKYRLLHRIEVIGWRMADYILAISFQMSDYIAGEAKRGVDIVLDPVNPDDFIPSDPIKPADKIVMTHGVLTRNKKIDILIRAAWAMPDVEFWVVGDGPDMKRLMSVSPHNVRYWGWVPFDEISDKISACDVGLALRSDNPGNEYVVTSPYLQYGIMGKPCLVTRRKVFGDYKWQFSSSKEMIEKLEALLEYNTARQEGAKLRADIYKNHRAKKIAEDIWKILQSA